MSQSADDLRETLFSAADDSAALNALCRKHADAVRQHFRTWVKVPKAIQERSDLTELYAHCLHSVAQTFVKQLGDDSLMRILSGPGENPVERWRAELDAARQQMSAMQFAPAASRLTDLAIDVGRLRGTAVDAYMPVVLATLGECLFESGQTERSITASRQALELIRKTGEDPTAYLGNLYEEYRYAGKSTEAAETAEALADLAAMRGELHAEQSYRAQAARLRAGEPLLRVVVDVDGRRFELDDVLQGIEGRVKFLFERNRLVLRLSHALTQQGEAEASKGNYAGALSLLGEASKADPYNPQPVYEAALTCMYLGRPSDAVEFYNRTEELAPGWFHCRSEGWLARQVAAGRYPLELAQSLHVLDGSQLSSNEKMKLLAKWMRQIPDLALLHHAHGKLLTEGQQAAPVAAAYRRGLACAEEPDIETRLLVDLASAVEDTGERRELCQRARTLNGNLVAVATAAIVLTFS